MYSDRYACLCNKFMLLKINFSQIMKSFNDCLSFYHIRHNASSVISVLKQYGKRIFLPSLVLFGESNDPFMI
jgi:hypothetical protein